MEHKWLNFDLHTHSYGSKNKDKAKVKEQTAAEFCKILMDNNVDVFSVTDHNNYDYKFYAELTEYIKEQNIYLLDGVEMDVYIESGVKSSDFFHCCIYFSKIENGPEFASKILEISESYPSIYDIVTKLHEYLQNTNVKFIMIPHADKADRNIKDIIGKLNNYHVEEYGKMILYKIFGAQEVKANFNQVSMNHYAANFNEISKVIKKDINYLRQIIKKKDRTQEEQDDYLLLEEYSKYFAYFNFSDWHNNEEYSFRGYNYVFGNTENIFGALECAILDPYSRIQRIPNMLEDDNQFIKNIEFEIKGEKHCVNFTQGLNVIFGERGSGKTLLLETIKGFNSHEQYKSYDSLNVIPLKIETFDGISKELGTNISTMQILEQNIIDKVFIDPDTSELFKNNFRIIDEEIESLEEIKKETKKLEQIKFSNTDICSSIKIASSSDIFTFSTEQHNNLTISDELRSIKKSISEIYKNLDIIGIKKFDVSQLKKYNFLMDVEVDKLVEKNKHYEDMIVKIDEKLREKNIESEEYNSSIKHSMETINNFKTNIVKQFNSLLTYKKVEFYINDGLKYSKIHVENNGDYLFVSSKYIEGDLGELLSDEIVSHIAYTKKKDSPILEYILGNIQLKANTKFIRKMDEFFDAIVQYQFEIYKIIGEITPNIATLEQLNKNVGEGNLISINKLSQGQKAQHYLDIIFRNSNVIHLYDQPEDNIDNNYISENLVPIIKKMKMHKQLIFVTHNPSIAVFGDAFNFIHCVKNDDNSFEYTNKYIDSLEDKEEIMRILDGGKASFMNRNQKYGNVIGVNNG